MTATANTLPERGASLREVERFWLEFGGRVSIVRRTGEFEYTHPAIPAFRVRGNNRRKDAPLALVHKIKRAVERLTTAPALVVEPAPIPAPPAQATPTPEHKEAPVSQSHEPYIRVETITPQRAAQLLAQMPTNRPLRQRTIQKYAREMMSGRWLLNGESIKLGKSGHIMDGQHRLNAIIMADIPVRTYVIYEVDDDAKLTIDTGIGRTFHDAGKIAGLDFPRNLTPVLRLWWLYECQSTPFSKTAPTHQELEAVRQMHPGAVVSVSFISKLGAIRRYMGPSVQAFVHNYCSEKYDRELADTFVQDLNDGADLPKHSPIFLLRRILIEGPGKGRRMDSLYVLALTVKAWNAWMDGDPIQALKYGQGEEFPRFGVTSKSARRSRQKRAEKRGGGAAA